MGGGGAPNPKLGHYAGHWGELSPGNTPQKGITSYSLSPNRQRPLAGTLHAAFFNTFRRTRNQILYVIPPLAAAYLAMDWAIKRNEYLNSKEGRMLEGDSE